MLKNNDDSEIDGFITPDKIHWIINWFNAIQRSPWKTGGDVFPFQTKERHVAKLTRLNFPVISYLPTFVLIVENHFKIPLSWMVTLELIQEKSHINVKNVRRLLLVKEICLVITALYIKVNIFFQCDHCEYSCSTKIGLLGHEWNPQNWNICMRHLQIYI